MELTIRLPAPHEKQRAIRKHPAKRHVICAGRRAGKTTLAAMVAIERALQGRRVLLASPTQDQAEAFWEKCREWTADATKAGIIYKNESLHLMRFPGGGRIRCKTAWNADTLRGDHADFLVLDEFADMDPDAWDKVGAPMLLDNDGDAWFISTPKRRNHFYNQFVRAQDDTTGRWCSWHFTSYDNPHLSQEALAEIVQDMTEDAIKQEIMAEFLPNDGSVFKNLDKCMNAPRTTPEDHKGHRVIMAVDWGQKQDYTAISVFCATCRHEVAIARFNQIDYHIQRGRLVEIARQWAVKEVWPEANSMGRPVIDELNHDPDVIALGLHIVPFDTTATSKPPMIQSLQLAFEKVEAQWLDDPVWTAELGAYEVNYSGQTGRPSYSGPKGVHDDTVMARGIVWYGAMMPQQVEYMPSLYT